MPQERSTAESSRKEAMPAFYCTQCGESLGILDGNIIRMDGEFVVDGRLVRAPFYIPARLGHYGAIVGCDYQLQDGQKVEFFCTNRECNANFTTDIDPDLAEVRMVESSGREYIVVFNRVYGHKSTFLVDRRICQVVGTYGEDAEDYCEALKRRLNFFGAV